MDVAGEDMKSVGVGVRGEEAADGLEVWGWGETEAGWRR